ncbi:helix-turn-helix transcriptional regulator [Ensifer sp. ENS04]|uniref:helix-turn-helix transcriptional regulator n=1 Tax=Ensifer sp. ENS04 TaxID=2769281 RepID=UPI00177FFD4D|nr:AraC family transcriptional regulator [Ensifer sp. ENS04]MBD9541465.1 helix-turn-helix transcriptional regulator [Ensifer sp. ENS04]
MTEVKSCFFSLPSPDLLRAQAFARQFDMHMHDTFSVVVLLEGAVSLRSTRWSETVRAGDVFMFNPLEVHSGVSLEGWARYEVLYPSQRFVSDCFCAFKSPMDIPVARTELIRRSEVTYEFLDALSAAPSATTSAETALCKLLRQCVFEPANYAANDLAVLRRACRLIEETYMFSIRTDMLAKHVGLHKSHFIRLFHRVAGITPETYLRQVRVAKARELICQGEALCQVAQSVGFFDQSHLHREFRKVYGVAPGRLARAVLAIK